MRTPVWHGSQVPARMKFCPTCASPLSARELEGHTRLVCSSETCDYVFYDNPVPVVAALIEHGETVLLVRNKGWPEKWYGLVSGVLEKGESPEQGVLREVKEEVGLKGEIVSFIGAYPFHEMNQIILAYHVRGTARSWSGTRSPASRRSRRTSCAPGRSGPARQCATGSRLATGSGRRGPEHGGSCCSPCSPPRRRWGCTRTRSRSTSELRTSEGRGASKWT